MLESWPQQELPGRIRPHNGDAEARPAHRELQPSGMAAALTSHAKTQLIRKEQLPDSLPAGHEQTSADQSRSHAQSHGVH